MKQTAITEAIYVADGDLKSAFAARKKLQREKRENNRLYATAFLTRHQVPFRDLNQGYMLRIEIEDEVIDFYPTTGLWKSNKGIDKRGVFNLWKHIRARLQPYDPNQRSKP